MSTSYNMGSGKIMTAHYTTSQKHVDKFPFSVISFGEFDCSPDYFTERSLEPECLLFYTIDGVGQLHYQNKEIIIPKNCAAVINCMEYQHYAPYPGKNWHFFWAHFSGKCAVDYVEMINENDFSVIDLSNRPDFIQYYESLAKLNRSMDKAQELYFSNLINELLSELILIKQRSVSEAKYGLHIPGIERTISYIHQHYQESISLDTLARISQISKFYFIHIFRHITGETPYSFLTLYRISQAKTLLSETTLSIAEIASETGFSDAKNFISAFKKNAGITPLQFRKTPHI